MATLRPASSAALETSIARLVLPVPVLPNSHRPWPWSSSSSTRRTNWRTGRTMTSCMSLIGGRSNETPPYLRGMTALRRRARRRSSRDGRQRQGLATRVASSITKPLPSQRSKGQGWSSLMRCARLRRPLEAEEAGVLVLEGQWDVAQAAVSVLGDDQLRLARPVGRLREVVLVAVDEHDEVGVLLEVARLPQVGEHRALVGPRLDAARELAERDHRHAELAREDLQATAHLTDLLDAALDARVGSHELEVVDDDQPEAAVLGLGLLVQPPRLGADVEDPDVGGVVDVQRRHVVLGRGAQHPLPLRLVAQPPLAQVVALDRGLRRDEPLGELGLGHLEAEQGNRAALVLLEGDVLGDVGHQGGFAHGRARRDDDQVAGLKAAGDRVEVGEAGWGAGQRAALGRELLPLGDLDVQDLADLAEVLRAVVVGDLEDGALGALDDLARWRLVAVHAGLDLVGGGEQAAQERALADDLRVLAQVADSGDGGRERVDLGLAAGRIEAAARAQVLGDREDVDRLARGEEREHRLVDLAMALAVEVLGLQPLLDDERVVRAIGEQHGPEDGLLGLDRVRRRRARRGGLRAVGA